MGSSPGVPGPPLVYRGLPGAPGMAPLVPGQLEALVCQGRTSLPSSREGSGMAVVHPGLELCLGRGVEGVEGREGGQEGEGVSALPCFGCTARRQRRHSGSA